jgi:L-aspartate oxidase
MTMNVGLERDARGLAAALSFIRQTLAASGNDIVLRNMATAAMLIAAAAYQRSESRGGHYRSDYRAASADWAHRTFLTLDDALSISARAAAEHGGNGLRADARP